MATSYSNNLSREHRSQTAALSSEDISSTSMRTMSTSHRGDQSFRMSSVTSNRRNSRSTSNWNNSGSISMLSFSSREYSARDIGVSQQQLSPRQEARLSGVFTTFSGTRYYHGADGGTPVPILDISSSNNSQPSNSRTVGRASSYVLHQQQQQHQQQQGEPNEFVHPHSVRHTLSKAPRRASEHYATTDLSSPDQRRVHMSCDGSKIEPPACLHPQQASGGSSGVMLREDDSMIYRRSHPFPNMYSNSGPIPTPPLPPPVSHTYNNHLQYNNYPRQQVPQHYQQYHPHPHHSEQAPVRPPYPRDSMHAFGNVPSCTIPRDLPPPSPPSPPPRFRPLEPIPAATWVVSRRHGTYFATGSDVELGITLDTATATTAATTATVSSSGHSTSSSHESHNNSTHHHKHQVQCCQCQIRLLVSKQAVSVQCPACHAVSAATNVHSFGNGSSLLTQSAAVAAAR